MRLLKWISLGFGALVALLLIAVLVIVWFVDPNSFKARIEAAVKDATGREMRLVGDIELGFFPWLSLRAGEGSFANAPGFGPEPMVTWKRAQVGAQLFPLLRGRLVADRVVLEGADLRLVRRADGSANWQGMGGNEPADPNAEPMEIRIDGVQIKDSRLSFVDESVPRRVEITGLNIETDEISPGEPLTDTHIAGVLRMDGFAAQGVPFQVKVPRVEAPRDFSSVKVGEFELAFGAMEMEGAVQGTLGDAPTLEGMIESNEFDPRALLTSVGIEAPKTTDPRALTLLKFAASWKLDGGAIALDPMSLAVDQTQLQGFFRRGGGEDPLGEFELRGNSIDLARYIPPPDPASEPFVLPTALIKSLKFRGTLQLDQAKLDDVEMKGVVLRLLLDEQGLRGVPAPETTP